jgi:hypothetical protein
MDVSTTDILISLAKTAVDGFELAALNYAA